MLLWYSDESPGVLRLRPRKQHEGWTVRYKFEDRHLVLSDAKRTWVCTKSEVAEIPDWFQSLLSKVDKNMSAQNQPSPEA